MWAGLAGGILIGLAAAVLLLFEGRIAGVSGVVGGTLRPRQGDLGWRLQFLGGLVAGGALLAWLWPGVFPARGASVSAPLMIAAGLLVGFGTQLGSGCTSGHGVCGLGRGSPRSLAAVLAFMATGVATVFVVRHLLGAP